ncbi:MAG: acylphosphatase [Bacteroidales bacterium]|nr:acylphosphatase [Bacteroidales bacterium]
MEKAVSIMVTGRVQNVGYRHYARLAANDYHITGKMQNNPDGSVYIEAQGKETDLEDFINYCRRGPSWARVDTIEINSIDINENYKDFN